MAQQKEFVSIKPLDIEKFIKVNKLKQVTNPIFFSYNNEPTQDGLLSQEIFGITMNDRANTFAYVDLGGPYFVHPLFYKVWSRIDRAVIKCIHGTSSFIINSNGHLEELKNDNSEEGQTGIEFLRKNIDKIKFRMTDSLDNRANITFLNKFKDLIFIKKYIIIPAFYRDVSTQDRYTGVGDINRLYANLIITSNSIKEYDKYGISLYNSVIGRVQDILNEIYEYFTKGDINGVSTGSGIAGKVGIMHAAVQSKTSDYSSRLVISAPNLKVENISDMTTDVDHTAVPLASAIVNFYPYILSYIKNFFANEYAMNQERPMIKNGKQVGLAKLKDYRIVFSDDILEDEIDRFVHGVSNRFRQIEYPTVDGKTYPIRFRGYTVPPEYADDDTNNIPESHMKICDRPMTWCDLLYMAAVEVTRDKMALITRYPIDSCYNQFSCKINVNSTIRTEPMIINGVLYRHYPKIDIEDLGTNTTDKFIDTLNISNVYLGSIDGDYDGDQVTNKSVFSIEANKELRDQLNSKRHFIGLDGKNLMKTTNEGVMVLYSLTMDQTDKVKYIDPVF